MLRRVSDGKPVEMQFIDDERIYSVSTVLARRAQERRRGDTLAPGYESFNRFSLFRTLVL